MFHGQESKGRKVVKVKKVGKLKPMVTMYKMAEMVQLKDPIRCLKEEE